MQNRIRHHRGEKQGNEFRQFNDHKKTVTMGEKKNNGMEIRLHTQKEGTFRVVVMKTTQIKDIISTIFPNRRHQKEKYLYKGKLLDDYTTVGEYDIKNGDNIYLLETELKNNTEKRKKKQY